jgi:single-stranded-DNA-specific exonuclease
MIWEKTEIDPGQVRDIARTFDLDLLTAAILTRRGVTDARSLPYHLEDDIRYLHNPFLFDEMEDAADRLLAARSEGEKVLVFGDRDVDGITSTALMVQTLQELGLDVRWRVPLGEEPYGLSQSEIDRFAADDGTLIVTVDCGTTNVAEIAHAESLGVDTIVCDHHNPQEQRPNAVAIINPKMPDASYPFPGLSGCAVAYKLREALFFAESEFYKQRLCLVNARPGNETVILEAVKLENLVEVDRLTESLVAGVVGLEDTRIGEFVMGHEVVCYDAEVQQQLFRQLFGNKVELNLLDLAPRVTELFPSLAGKSLLRIREGSRLSRYGTLAEVDVLVELFRLSARKSIPGYEERLHRVLDLVALGTLGDMMPLSEENRILVKLGLRRLADSPSVGLRALLERQRLIGKENITARDVSFQLTPALNAAGRLGQADAALRLLLAETSTEAAKLAQQVVGFNDERRTLGDAAWERVLPLARESAEALDGKLVLVDERSVHRGITGILAGKLSKMFGAPAAVVTQSDERGVGSLRSTAGVSATGLLQQCEDLLSDWGGHDQAAGFEVAVDNIEHFLERMKELAAGLTLQAETEPRIAVDAELPQNYLTPNLEKTVFRLGPFGQEYPPLVFLARGLRVEQLDFMGKEEQHVRLLLAGGAHRWPAVYWNAADAVGNDFNQRDTVDVVFEINKNFYQQRETTQLIVLDLQRSGADRSAAAEEEGSP